MSDSPGSVIDGFPEPDRRGAVLSSARSGFHRIAYVEWGDPGADRVVLCVHGLSRQGRDFDRLAAALAARGWRVVCPDLVGRGQSDWLRDKDEYTLPQYVMDMTVLLAQIGAAEISWIGTSLGGLTGMVAAGQARAPIRRLIVNDIGPSLPWQALHRLAFAVRDAPRQYPNLETALAAYRVALAPFGPLTEAELLHLTLHTFEQLPDGTCRKWSDPDIIATFRPGFFFNLSLWSYWDAITCPTLVIRGMQSDLLTASAAADMTRRGPRADLVELPDCGHAPALMNEEQIGLVTRWLEAN